MLRRFLLVTAAALLVASPCQVAGAQADSAPADGPVADDGGGVEVHSWALAPTGSEDPREPGNRPFFSYEAAAGTTVEDSLTIANYGNVPLNLRVYATDAFNNADGHLDILAGHETPTEVGTWISLPQENVTVPPRRQVSMPIKISIPADASPGDHAGALLASSSVGGTGPDGRTVNLDRRTGSRVYIRVAGAITAELALEDMITSYTPTLNPLGGRLEVTYQLVNRGNVRLQGTEDLSASLPFGLMTRKAPRRDLPELLPGESVTRRFELENVPAGFVVAAGLTVTPSGSSDDPATAPVKAGAWSFAIPFAIVAGALLAGLLHHARHAYRRRQGGRTDLQLQSS